MNGNYWLEAVGYLGSVLVIISMLMTSVVRLRVINLTGSAIFTIYALLIGSYPTAFLNACLVIINIHQLRKLSRADGRNYDVHEISAGEGFISWFTEKYMDDIRLYFPGFDSSKAEGATGYAVFYEDEAAGILLGCRDGGVFDVILDYTTPKFRDCSVGRFLYDLIPNYGIRDVSCKTGGEKHLQYLRDMGFELSAGGIYVKHMGPEKQ